MIVEVTNGQSWRGFAVGSANESVVELAVYAEEARMAGWGSASGAIAVDLILRTLLDDGHVLEAIEGCWHPTSDNFSQYERLRRMGADADLAALGTWTGVQAARHGFVEVSEVSELPDCVRALFVRAKEQP